MRSGKCQCGAVQYLVEGEPLRVGLCHCTDCRQTSGSAFTMFAVWPRAAFRTSAQVATFRGRSFCPNCGSRVFSLRPDEAEVMCGTLDDAPTGLIPSYELWMQRREDWMLSLPWAQQYQSDREPNENLNPLGGDL
jgi:hypothetical protein